MDCKPSKRRLHLSLRIVGKMVVLVDVITTISIPLLSSGSSAYFDHYP